MLAGRRADRELERTVAAEPDDRDWCAEWPPGGSSEGETVLEASVQEQLKQT